jgi:low temperature requirement protein LtrA
MVVAVMIAGLFMNASLTRAFNDAAWVFVATFLGIQLGRTAWMLTTQLDPINRDHFVATLIWLAATAPSGSPALPPPGTSGWPRGARPQRLT